MKTAGVREFKAQLSHYLREVQQGETLLVTDRGRVVAEVRPPGKATRELTPASARVLAAVEEGLLRLPNAAEPSPLWEGVRPLGLPRGAAQSLLDEARAERE